MTGKGEGTNASAESAAVKAIAAPRVLAAVAAVDTPAARSSPLDLAMLKSLDAKLHELTAEAEAEAKEARSRRRGPIGSALSSTASVISGYSELTGHAPAVDSTQTVRPLTCLEVETCEARWFSIQLVLSSSPIELAQVPRLGIFEEYRLYLVMESEQDRLAHALRLGFFSSEIAAATVVRYLSGYFPLASILRVSAAERERFADKNITAGKDVGVYGRRVSIELLNSSVGRFGYASLRH